MLLDRQKLETVLRRRFPEATHPQVAAAANAIMKLGEESESAERDPGRARHCAESAEEPGPTPETRGVGR
jgi:hypothetical protein